MENSQDQSVDMVMEPNALPSEAWDCWMNEELQLDAEAPMDSSTSLWDNLAESNDSVARSLFACIPSTQVRAASSLLDQESGQMCGSWHDPALISEGRDTTFANVSEDLSSAPMPVWFMPNEQIISSSPHYGVEQPAESWISGYFNGDDACTTTAQQGSMQQLSNSLNGTTPKCSRTEEERGLPHRDRCVKRGGRPLSQDFPESQHCVNAKKFAPLRGKQSSKRTLVRSISDTQVLETTSQKPIVYPFALVKPCGIRGDATLKDINRRISMASTVESPLGQSNAPSPSLSPSPSSSPSPFSGKPILAVTKIHTEGKGTITIMRTRS